MHEPVLIATMDDPERRAAVPNAAHPGPSRQPSADVTGQLINQKSAEEFQDELEKQIKHTG